MLATDKFSVANIVVPQTAISVGFPYRARGKGNNAIGQCWHKKVANDKMPHVFVSPVLEDTQRVVGVLAHELVHAAIGTELGHGKEFERVALAIGLTGKMTATVETDQFKQWVSDKIIPSIGPYPHGALNIGAPGTADDPKLGPTGAPKQTTRLLKLECPSCGCVIRITKRWLDLGAPKCACPDHKTFQPA